MPAAPDSGTNKPAKHVVVIGAGIIGAMTALELLRRGHRVTVVDPEEPGGPHAASYGNGGWLSPSLVVPLSLPGLWRRIPRYLTDPTGPLTIRWRHLPRLAPWLARFLWASLSPSRAEATARALAPLVADCHHRHAALAEAAGVGELIEREGQIQVYRDRAGFEAETFAWHLRRLTGCRWTEIDAAELRRREPTLDRRYTFAVHVPGYNCVKPGLYVAALIRRAEHLGAVRLKARALGFSAQGRSAAAVRTDAGDIACDAVVIAAGIRSKPLAAAAGDRVSLEAERGYHVELVGMQPMPKNRILLMDGRMANTPSRFGFRVTGHVEFASLAAAPDWRHTELLKAFTLGAYGLDRPPDEIRTWMGARPSTPDSLPVIGRASGLANVLYAFGHGHIGVASAPNTAGVVADLVDGSPAAFDLAAYSPRRFGLWRRAEPAAPARETGATA